ncbi:hypothetical protein [Halalkalibacter oceani]|uniref:hypothetical protein n=1 Tax=Halalkalibacter oceani TaxID=1653776 RepID=UPI0025596BB4|nr:hypothetical protein [Halalkalibacter oceani]
MAQLVQSDGCNQLLTQNKLHCSNVNNKVIVTILINVVINVILETSFGSESNCTAKRLSSKKVVGKGLDLSIVCLGAASETGSRHWKFIVIYNDKVPIFTIPVKLNLIFLNYQT